MSSIKPDSGWDPLPAPSRSQMDPRLMPLQAQRQPAYEDYPGQRRDVRSNGNYFACKVCDRGAMSQKKIYRMSLPWS
jgi:hypothetical protein